MSLLDPASVPMLAERYPRAPGRLRHYLAAEPLLGLTALAEAARALPPRQVGYGGDPCGRPEELAPEAPSLSPAEMLAAGGPSDHGVLLRGIERLPRYRALLNRLLDELAPVITPATGPLQNPAAEVFIASSSTRTPFHFDTEYTLLFQISGDRLLAAYPPAPPFLDLTRREAYYSAGENRLEWHSGFAAAGEQHVLMPGDAVFVPYAAPHWVHVGDGPSIALSLKWQCRRSRAEADALALNPLLRRLGLPPYDPAAARSAPWLRAAAGRAGRRIGLV